MKRVLVVAGGKWQVPLVKKLKEMQYEVVCSNLYEDSPAFKYADFHEVADVRDKEKNLLIAKKYSVDGIVTDQSDIAVPTVAYVADKLGLRTIGTDLAELFTNKFKMREFLIEKKFPCPEYKICTKIEEAKEFLLDLNHRAILKPLDSQSSRGIYEIESMEDLDKYFNSTRECSKDKRNVLIERYINGTEFTADGISINGKHKTLAISEKSHYGFNHNVADSLYFTHNSDKYDYDVLRKLNDEIINQSGLPFGLTHAEYKYENGNFYLIEMAARGGGTKISSDIVPYMSGVDNYAIWISQLLSNQKMEREIIIGNDCLKRQMILQFLDCDVEEKEIDSIDGIDTIMQQAYILDFNLNIKKGDIIKRATDDSTRIGYYIAVLDSYDEVEQIKKYVYNTLKIRFKL